MRKLSENGLKLIKNFEGCRLTAYKPVPTETYWTIGWGHYGPDVKQGQTITQAEADAMLERDMGKYEAYVNNPAYVPITGSLNQNQFDALTSFCYNCGNGSLKTLCNGRTADQISQNIVKYNKGGGKVLAGLVRRRKAEQDLFNTPVTQVVKEEETVDKVNVFVNGKKTVDGAFMVDGSTYPAAKLLADLGIDVHWDNASKTLYLKNKEGK